jgi:hypothetical protein
MSQPSDAAEIGINPYQSPLAAGSSADLQVLPNGVYRSGRLLAMWTIGLLVSVVLADVAGVYSGISRSELIDAALDGFPVDDQRAVSDNFRYWLTETAYKALLVPAAILFVLWEYRAYRNLGPLGARRIRHSPAMAVGWWFVPVAWWFNPCSTMLEIWRNSDPQGTGLYGRSRPASLIGVWWSIVVVGTIGALMVFGFSQSLNHSGRRMVEDYEELTQMTVLLHLFSLVGAMLALLIVFRISAMQDARFEKVQQMILVAEAV